MAIVNQVSGGRYRILRDEINKEWDEISFVNLAQDTICEDGMSVEEKVGDIVGLVTTQQDTPGYVMDASVTALAPKVFNGTLRPDSETTTLTFVDSAINDTAKISVYTSQWGYIPDDVTVSGNTLTIEFPIPDDLITIKVEVGEFQG